MKFKQTSPEYAVYLVKYLTIFACTVDASCTDD